MNIEKRPICKCHSIEMVHSGHWRCKIKKQKNSSRYHRSIKGYIWQRTRFLNERREKIIKQLKELHSVK